MATAATAAGTAAEACSVEPSELACPVCHEPYTEPKILPCAHILCRHCLVEWLQANPDAQCPLCRSQIADVRQRSPQACESIADVLPTDLSMVQLVESLQTLNKEHVCCACLDVSAVTMCQNCNDMLCRPCATAHGRLTATRHHQVEDLTSLTAERLASSRPTPCQNHSEKTSELFCPSHGATICHLCAVSKHRTCPEVTELEVKVQQLRNELDNLVAVLKSRETEIRQAIHQLDEELMLTEERRQTAIREIDEACDRLQKSVEACRTRLKKLINSASADSKVVVNIENQKLARWLGKVTTHQCMIRRVRKTGCCLTLHTMVGVLKQRLHDLASQTDLHDRAKIITRATVTIDQKTVTRLESELCRIGALTNGDAALDNQLAYPLFHSNHGKFIVLTDDKTSAEKQKAEKHGTVLLDRPMIVNKLYEVIVENTVHSRFLYIRAGITIQHPASLTLPNDAYHLKEAVLIGDSYVIVHGKRKVSSVGALLSQLKPLHRVGLLVDSSGWLHLYINGFDQGVAARNVPLPCFAFFELLGQNTKITRIPLDMKSISWQSSLPI